MPESEEDDVSMVRAERRSREGSVDDGVEQATGGYQGMEDDEAVNNSPSGGDGASRDLRPPEPWSMRLHHLIVGTAMFSSILLLMIIASRSWGVGHDRTTALSAGIWEVCLNNHNGDNECKSWSSFCPPASSRVMAGGAFTIISLLIAIFMVPIDAFEMMRPTTFRLHHITITVISHLLWVCLLCSWTLFTGAMTTACGDAILIKNKDEARFKPNTHMWYAWGWMFLIWMWLVHLVVAVLLTLKYAGKKLPCGL